MEKKLMKKTEMTQKKKQYHYKLSTLYLVMKYWNFNCEPWLQGWIILRMMGARSIV